MLIPANALFYDSCVPSFTYFGAIISPSLGKLTPKFL